VAEVVEFAVLYLVASSFWSEVGQVAGCGALCRRPQPGGSGAYQFVRQAGLRRSSCQRLHAPLRQLRPANPSRDTWDTSCPWPPAWLSGPRGGGGKRQETGPGPGARLSAYPGAHRGYPDELVPRRLAGAGRGAVRRCGLRTWRSAAVTAALVVVVALALTVFGTSWLPGAITGRVQDLGSYVTNRTRPGPRSPMRTSPSWSALRTGRRACGCSTTVPGWGRHRNYAASYADTPQPHWYEPLATRTTSSSTLRPRLASWAGRVLAVLIGVAGSRLASVGQACGRSRPEWIRAWPSAF